MTNDLNNIPASVRDALQISADDLENPPSFVDMRDAILEALPLIERLCKPNIVIVDLEDVSNVKYMLKACEGIEDLEDCMVASLAALKGK